MGTNYYTASNVCDHCHRHDRDLHIGKLSSGWTFNFQGYRAESDLPRIESYAQWLDLLAAARIFDEYGTEISLTDFKELVENKRDEKFNHTIYCREHHPQYARDECWLDDEGNSFSSVDFG